MATVSLDILRKNVTDHGLDRMIVRNGSKAGGRILEADGSDKVMAALDDIRDRMSGLLHVQLWKTKRSGSDEKNAASYEAEVYGGAGGQSQGVGAFGGGDMMGRLFDTSIALERMKLEREYDKGNDRIGKLADVLLQYLPVAAASVGIKLPKPVNGASTADQGDDDDGDETAEGGIGSDELEGLLTDVAQYAKRNPDQARAYREMLRKMTGDGKAND